MLRPLTEKGEADAVRLTEFFQDKGIDVVLSSPYIRAMDTVIGIADELNQEIITDFDFRERRVADGSWIDGIDEFIEKQWNDFDYKLPEGECLKEVQDRNIRALFRVLKSYEGKNIVIGSHGTALSTVVNYFDSGFSYESFLEIVGKMPWVVQLVFDGECLVSIDKDVSI